MQILGLFNSFRYIRMYESKCYTHFACIFTISVFDFSIVSAWTIIVADGVFLAGRGIPQNTNSMGKGPSGQTVAFLANTAIYKQSLSLKYSARYFLILSYADRSGE